MLSKIQAKNFMSWKSLEFDLKQGITLIDGFNEDDQTSEGSGKSSVLNALSWCLYGKIPKDTKIDDVIKDGEKGCVVSVKFESGEEVLRSRKPNSLQIIVDGKVIKGKDAKETQSLIEELVGFSFDTFCQSVYFAQNYSKKFINSNQEEKAKILSEVQDLKVFDAARKECVAAIKNLKEEITGKEYNLGLIKKDISNLENTLNYEKQILDKEMRQLNEQKTQVIESIKDKEGKKGLIESKIQEMKQYLDQLESLDMLDAEAAQLKKEEVELKVQKSQYESNLANIDNIIRENDRKIKMGNTQKSNYYKLIEEKTKNEDFLKNPDKKCPTCGSETMHVDLQPILNRNLEIDKQIEEIVEYMKDLSSSILDEIPTKDGIQKTISEINALLNEIATKQHKVETTKRNRLDSETKLKMIREELKAIPEEIDKLEKNLKLLNEVQFSDQKIVDAQNKVYDKMEDHTKIESDLALSIDSKVQYEELKDGFREVKSYVFNNLIDEINYKVNNYAQNLFESNVEVNFSNDSMKIETDIKLDGKERSLGLLSGGQHKRVSMATDLALSDIVCDRKGSKIGTLILDEPFQNMSETSMQKTINLLKDQKKPVVIIEHNSVAKSVIDQTFFVSYKNGESSEQI